MQAKYGTGVVARASRWNFASVLVTFVLLSVAPLARGQTDNFNDGSDIPEWTRYAPLDPFGPDTSYTFPDGGYRIVAPPTPNRTNFGPGRAGSLREDANYSQFYA